ncbi:hypothetical protein CP532_2336 [Ophiocordyceps camponoti-leonardi (nom. inval.)]|nr:hypothetical protein CP532_2336 [Ophiocordyceps camponoti-leonardi (nom. inval.)]
MEDQKDKEKTGPPAQFFILSSPNEKENGKLSCPDQGCDGTAFLSAADRHARASGHQLWACRRRGCEFEGVVFDSCAAYQVHSVSGIHLGRGGGDHQTRGGDEEDDDIYGSDDKERDTKRAGNDKNHRQTSSPNSTATVDDYDSDSDSFLCLEPCCPSYKTKGWGKGTFIRHVHNLGHSKAVSAGESLRAMNLSSSELASRQAVFRELRCDERGMCALRP